MLPVALSFFMRLLRLQLRQPLLPTHGTAEWVRKLVDRAGQLSIAAPAGQRPHAAGSASVAGRHMCVHARARECAWAVGP